MGCLPVVLDVTALDEGEGIAKTLLLRRAKHHRKCQMNFKPVRLQQAQKRSLNKDEMDGEENETSKKRLSRHGITSNVGRCYFCEKTDGKLHLVTSLRLDRRVRLCAAILVETEEILNGKLNSNGDMIAQDAMYHAR